MRKPNTEDINSEEGITVPNVTKTGIIKYKVQNWLNWLNDKSADNEFESDDSFDVKTPLKLDFLSDKMRLKYRKHKGNHPPSMADEYCAEKEMEADTES